MKKLLLLLVPVLALIPAQAGAIGPGRAHTAARCAYQIVTVLDAEAAGDVATADAVVPNMGPKCLTIGAAAEGWRDAGYTIEQVTQKIVAAVARRYHVTQNALARAYQQDWIA